MRGIFRYFRSNIDRQWSPCFDHWSLNAHSIYCSQSVATKHELQAWQPLKWRDFNYLHGMWKGGWMLVTHIRGFLWGSNGELDVVASCGLKLDTSQTFPNKSLDEMIVDISEQHIKRIQKLPPSSTCSAAPCHDVSQGDLLSRADDTAALCVAQKALEFFRGGRGCHEQHVCPVPAHRNCQCSNLSAATVLRSYFIVLAFLCYSHGLPACYGAWWWDCSVERPQIYPCPILWRRRTAFFLALNRKRTMLTWWISSHTSR